MLKSDSNVKYIKIHDLSESPTEYPVNLTKEQCKSIGKRLGVISLDYMRGVIQLSKASKSHPIFGNLFAYGNGQLKARVNQTCVISLNSLNVVHDISFNGIIVKNKNLDPIETNSNESLEILTSISDDTIQISEIFIEQLSLELDPFPKKNNIKFDGYSTESKEIEQKIKENPFAALSKYKDNFK